MDENTIHVMDKTLIDDSQRIAGWVEIHDSSNKKIWSDHNTIVYGGRKNIPDILLNMSDLKIRGVSIGTGGYILNDTSYRKLYVHPTDTSLNNEIQWSEDSNELYVSNGEYNIIRKILPQDESDSKITISTQFDPNNLNEPLIRKISIPITNIVANDSNNDNMISEAGLWLMDENYSYESRVLYAKTTFSPIPKNINTSYKLIWYLLF